MPLKTLKKVVRHEEEIKRSRFLVIAAPCPDEAAVEAFFAEHAIPGASHNCFAWRVGQTYRFNDDGEPASTAGRPILQAIDGQGFDQVAVLVVRWFGGIKLGAGGLVRAYGGSASRCLQQADTLPLIAMAELTVEVPFEDLGIFHNQLARFGAEVVSEAYATSGLKATVLLPEVDADNLLQHLRDASGGRMLIV